MTTADTTHGPAVRLRRDRILDAAAESIRANGVRAANLRDIVRRAGAPWGSWAHYFPDGKNQLVREALARAGDAAADRVNRWLAETAAPSPSGLFAEVVAHWQREFADHGFERGCLMMATTVDVAATDEELRLAVAASFAVWTAAIADGLVAMQVKPARAAELATLMLSALEGALVLARASRDAAPLDIVVRGLEPVLDSAITI